MTAKSTAQRQQALRQRRADLGLTEVRGLYAPADKHAEIKRLIREHLKDDPQKLPTA